MSRVNNFGRKSDITDIDFKLMTLVQRNNVMTSSIPMSTCASTFEYRLWFLHLILLLSIVFPTLSVNAFCQDKSNTGILIRNFNESALVINNTYSGNIDNNTIYIKMQSGMHLVFIVDRSKALCTVLRVINDVTTVLDTNDNLDDLHGDLQHEPYNRGNIKANVSEFKRRLLIEGNSIHVPDVDTDTHGNPVVIRGNSRIDVETGLPLEIWTKDPVIEFVLIREGHFSKAMPSLMNDPDNSKHISNISISYPFYLSKYEITQIQWKKVMGYNPSMHSSPSADNPVDSVSWNESFLFCLRLGLSIPSEAQWEYASGQFQGSLFGLNSSDSSKSLSNYAWHFNNSNGKTHRVGLKLPNEFGLYDMFGNVSEHCYDYYIEYKFSRVINNGIDPLCLLPASRRVAKGGSYSDDFIRDNIIHRKSTMQFTPSGLIGLRPLLKIK